MQLLIEYAGVWFVLSSSRQKAVRKLKPFSKTPNSATFENMKENSRFSSIDDASQ